MKRWHLTRELAEAREGAIWISGERENSKQKGPARKHVEYIEGIRKRRGSVDRVSWQLDLLCLLSQCLGSHKIVNSKGKYKYNLLLVALNHAPVWHWNGLMFKFWILFNNNYIPQGTTLYKTWLVFIYNTIKYLMSLLLTIYFAKLFEHQTLFLLLSIPVVYNKTLLTF